MQNIMVIFGGCSSEYSVSLESASSVIEGMDKSRFTPVTVGITRDGQWYHYSGETFRITNGTWCESGSCRPAALSVNTGEHCLLVQTGNGTEKIPVDAVFPVLHGRNGEDGTVQGLCTLAGVPLVGCGVLASALCMDKDRAHRLARDAGVKVPRSVVLEPDFDPAGAAKSAQEIGYPVFVKPVNAGSSYGVSKVTGPDGLLPAVAGAFEYDARVIVEQAIPGFETGCAVMGNSELVTGEVDEIELAGGFFNFTEKYNLITSKIHVPARVPPETAARLKETAKTVYRALDCRGFARVDMFLTPEGEIVFNEVNTIPGFTSHSRFPSMMKAVGVSFTEVITRAIELAMENRTV